MKGHIKAENNTAVVVLSGGQDSVTCLGYAKENYDHVYAIGFAYGQKHMVEIAQADHICMLLGIEYTLFDIPMLNQLGDSKLLASQNNGESDVMQPHHRNKDLPASFVPNRNALFLTTAHAYAQKVGASVIITGVCQTDYSGYPDCRQEFINSLEFALNQGYLTNITIATPLMNMSKAEIFQYAEDMGILDIVVEHSHTCYNGDRSQKWEWGAGCGNCPACELRADGYHDYLKNKGLS